MKWGIGEIIALFFTVALSLFLNVFAISNDGLLNNYYAVTVQSMMQNGHNFLFAALDPEGFISVDKPPLGYWIQCLSVWLFGFHGWALALPQALAATAAVGFTYFLVRRYFGATAALFAALSLAVTPIFVAVARNNTVDATLSLVLLIASWSLLLAVERKTTKYLVVAFVLVAVGFHIKMMAAFLVLPAFYVVYWAAVDRSSLTKIGRLVAATGVLFLVSAIWILVVETTPADQRPFVGGTRNNSAFELTVLYNGVARLLPGDVLANVSKRTIHETTEPSAGDEAETFFEFEIGESGPFRLLNYQMATQISWFLPIILVGVIVAWFTRQNLSIRQKATLGLFCGWAVPGVILFSFAALMHRYYLSLLAVPLAVLFGISASGLLDLAEKKNRWAQSVLLVVPAALLYQLFLVVREHHGYRWLGLLLAVGFFGSVGVFIYGTMKRRMALLRFSFIGAMALLLLAPLVWSLTLSQFGGHPIMPFAGPNLDPELAKPYSPGQEKLRREIRKFKNYHLLGLERYLTSHFQQERFLAAVPCGLLSAPMMIHTGLPVLTMGGFHGRDPAVTVAQLKHLVGLGQLRYIALSPHFQLMPSVTRWVEQEGRLIPREEWNRAEDADAHRSVERRITATDHYLAQTFSLYDLQPGDHQKYDN